MMTLTLWPIWIIDIIGSLLVIVMAGRCLKVVRQARAHDPTNARWLFFYWLTLTLVAFALSRSVGHILQHLLVFSGQAAFWEHLRPFSGGLNSLVFVAIAAVSLFFLDIQRLYRRMVADHRQLETTSRDILELNREMEALVMERTVSEMALGIAHGIRNPLHIIGGFSQRLLKKTDPDDPVRTWAQAIAEASRCLEQMVERFESLAQRKESFFVSTDLNELINEILEMLHPEMESRDIRLITSLHASPLYARINKHLLRVAFSHLFRNAIEATPAQGEIRAYTALEGNQAVVIIQDTGRGMDPEAVKRVMVPFYTTKLGGTGLGMVFVHQIVDEHRGTINLDSQVAQGTTVTIKLPLRPAETPGVSGAR